MSYVSICIIIIHISSIIILIIIISIIISITIMVIITTESTTERSLRLNVLCEHSLHKLLEGQIQINYLKICRSQNYRYTACLAYNKNMNLVAHFVLFCVLIFLSTEIRIFKCFSIFFSECALSGSMANAGLVFENFEPRNL